MGLAAIEISGELFQAMITKGWEAEYIKCLEGLPEGAIFRGSYIRQWEGVYVRKLTTVVLVFEHPEFKESDSGDVIPYIRVVHQEFYKCAEE